MTDYERTTTRETTTGYEAGPGVTSIRTTEGEYVPGGPSGLVMVARIVTFAFGILQAVLILRIVLLLLVANAGNDVVSFILALSDPFIEPFHGMFALDRVRGDQGSLLDVAAIVALIGWTLVEMLILAALRIGARRPSEI